MNLNRRKNGTDLFPWEREGPVKKPLGALPRRPCTFGAVRSLPPVAGQQHLEYYLRCKDKGRLERLGKNYGELLKATAARWKAMDRKTKQLEKMFLTSLQAAAPQQRVEAALPRDIARSAAQ